MADIIQLLANASTNPGAVLDNLILPFFLIFAILWGMLTVVGIFKDRKINIVISLVLTLMVIIANPLGFVDGIAGFLGSFAIWIFVIVFVILAVLWMVNRSKEVVSGLPHGRHPDVDNINTINKQIDKLLRKLEDADARGDEHMVREYQNDIAQLRDKKRMILNLPARGH